MEEDEKVPQLWKRDGPFINWLRARELNKRWELKRHRPKFLRWGLVLSLGVYYLSTKFQKPPEVVDIGKLYSDEEPVSLSGQKVISRDLSSAPTFLQYTKYKVSDALYQAFNTSRFYFLQNVTIPMRAYVRKFSEEYRLDFIYELEALNNKLPSSWRYSDYPVKLLPDPLPETLQQPLTLCLEMELFLEPATRRKRAGVDRFLAEVSQFCEVVLLSNVHPMAAGKMMKKLDKSGAISFRIGHLAFRRGDEQGVLTPRYLNRLNRDLTKVLCIDYSKQMYPENRENVLILPQEKWYLNPHDTDLLDIIPIIKGIARQVHAGQDVRKIVEEYDDVDPARVGRVILGNQPVTPHFRTLDFQQIKLLPDEEEVTQTK